MRTAPKPLGKATYVASNSDKEWLQNEQRKLYTRSWGDLDYVFRKLWGLVTDPHNLRCALARVSRNRGSRTAGVDGITVRQILTQGAGEEFVEQIRAELRSGTYRPAPVRRILIPKPGQPGKHRPLGIPTVRDRVVQAALKHILEPIFEADFSPCSYGFRPGTGVHAALEELRKLLLPKKVRTGRGVEIRFPYQWAIEGDIKGCFDHIGHHGLMNRIRRRVTDAKVNRLIVAFLKAGILSEGIFLRSESGTPQGGILSPLLANIALSVIDERYERTVWPRQTRTHGLTRREILRRAAWNRSNAKRRGKVVFVPVRYADDFIILVGVAHQPGQCGRAETAAYQEKVALAKLLKDELGLELSEAKTKVTKVTSPLRFLGHHVRVQLHPQYGWCGKAVIPKDRSQKLRHAIKAHFDGRTCNCTLQERLEKLNPILRGWGNFYRHAWGAKKVFVSLDHYLWWTIMRWLKKKHQKRPMKWFRARYGWRKPGGKALRWQDGNVRPFQLASLRVERFRHAWLTPPNFATSSMESPVHNERCTPGSVRGMRKPTRGEPG